MRHVCICRSGSAFPGDEYPASSHTQFHAVLGYLCAERISGFECADQYYNPGAERKGIAPPKWIKPVIIFSIPWAVSIHTVTAFLYAGLGARPFWMTAILAPRFLASAFAAGPALLILLCLLLRKITKFDAGEEPIKKLSVIVTYAMIINVFFVLMEIFTAIYSNIPEHMMHFQYMYLGLDGKTFLVPWMWASTILSLVSLVFLIVPKFRANFKLLTITCIMVFIALWIDKGLGLIVTGFIPSVLGEVVEYHPTFPEIMITIAIYCLGALACHRLL